LALAEFRVLGPVEVRLTGLPVDLGPAKQRSVLAALLLDAGQVVAGDVLIDRVWSDSPPAEVRSLLYTHVSRIRRLLATIAVTDEDPVRLARRSGGYVLGVDPERVDVHRFRRLVAQARAVDAPGDAADLYRQAHSLWRGSFSADLPGVWFDLVRAELDGERLATLASRFDAELLAGRHAEVLAELRALSAAHPLDERLAGQAMLAGYRSGRQAEALKRYEQIRRGLADGLGVDPCPDLQQLYHRILHTDPTLAGTADIASQPATSGLWRVPIQLVTQRAPAQLPHDPGGFAGRVSELAELHRLARDDSVTAVRTSVVIVTITGTAGVGKTALAVHWTYQVREQFPDGQLYVNLRGYAATTPMRAIAALAGFLHALGLPVEQIPIDVEHAAALYRSLLADKRLLIVLDNAHDAEQVRPLLPGSPRCMVLVTSRDRLAGLVARDGAHRLVLDVLTSGEAWEVLAGVLGQDRLDAEPDATAELIDRCARLPLALRIAAAALTDRPWRSVADYVAELTADDRLLALGVDGDEGMAIHAAFDLSYNTLTPAAQRLFRLMGLAPGPDVTAEAAASLAAASATQATRLLAELVRGHLITEHAPGRYTFHDLLRAYAVDRARRTDDRTDREAAAGRLLDWYLQTTLAAARVLYHRKLSLPLPPASAEPVTAFRDPAQALAWLDAERTNLVAAIGHAAEHGPRPYAWRLNDAVRGYFHLHPHAVDWLSAAGAGLAAALADEDLHGQAAAHLSLADASRYQSRYQQALKHYTCAMNAAQQVGWSHGEAAGVGNLGLVYWETGQLKQAIEQLTRALAIYQRLGSVPGQVANLTNLGMTLGELGRLDQAADRHKQVLALTGQLGTSDSQAIHLSNVAELLHLQGHLDQARDQLTNALTLHREFGSRTAEGWTLALLAGVHRDAGRHLLARDNALAALAIIREAGHRRYEAGVLSTLASIHDRLGQSTAAIEHGLQALALAREIGARYPEVAALIGLAAAHLHRDQPDRALVFADQAATLARDAGYRMYEGQALTEIADVHRALDHSHQAIGYAR